MTVMTIPADARVRIELSRSPVDGLWRAHALLKDTWAGLLAPKQAQKQRWDPYRWHTVAVGKKAREVRAEAEARFGIEPRPMGRDDMARKLARKFNVKEAA